MLTINGMASYVNRTDSFKWINLIVLLISILVMFLPLIIIYDLPDYVTESVLAKTIYHNQTITVAYLCSICAAMPLIIDIVLDICSNDKVGNYYNRFFILLFMIFPGIFYILFNDDDIFPIIFINLLKVQFGMMIHITLSYIVEYAPQQLSPTLVFYLGAALYSLSSTLFSCSLLVTRKSTSKILSIMSSVSFYIAFCMLIFITYKWMKYLYTLHKDHLPDYNKYYNKHNQACLLLRIASFTVIGSFLSVLPGTYDIYINIYIYHILLISA